MQLKAQTSQQTTQTHTTVERKRAPYAVKSCQQCRKRRLKCLPVIGRSDCVRCASSGITCSGVVGPSSQSLTTGGTTSSATRPASTCRGQQRSSPSSSSSSSSPTQDLVLSPPSYKTSIVHLNKLTERQVSYAYSFHLLNSHLESEMNCIASDCWVVFQGVFYRTGGIGTSTQQLVSYIGDLSDGIAKPRQALTSSLDRMSPAFSKLDTEILKIIETSNGFEQTTSLDQLEEQVALLIHAADTIETVDNGGMHRLHGVSASSFLPLVKQNRSSRFDFNNWKTTQRLAKSLLTASSLFTLAHGVPVSLSTRQAWNSLWPHGVRANGLPMFHTPTPIDMALVFSPTLSEPLLDLTRDLIIHPLVIRLQSSIELLIMLSGPASDEGRSRSQQNELVQQVILSVWEWIDEVLSYTQRMFDQIAQHNRFQQIATAPPTMQDLNNNNNNRTTTDSMTNGAQFVLRELVLIEQLSGWILIATHQLLKKRKQTCFNNFLIWSNLSREKIKFVVRNLETRLDILLAFILRPVHFARLMQLLGRTVEAAYKVLEQDGVIRGTTSKMSEDHVKKPSSPAAMAHQHHKAPLSETSVSNEHESAFAPNVLTGTRDDELFATSLRLAAQRRAGRRPDRFEFIASALEQGMKALSLSSSSPPRSTYPVKTSLAQQDDENKQSQIEQRTRSTRSSSQSDSNDDVMTCSVPGMSCPSGSSSRDSSLPSSPVDATMMTTGSMLLPTTATTIIKSDDQHVKGGLTHMACDFADVRKQTGLAKLMVLNALRDVQGVRV
ncbi:hypothetical protein OIO90_003954 [Microbotryomycetes sp. JL221]|nr:hypothetical protein OIO90_003954 [Microbotryomycetes sp. JL221]